MNERIKELIKQATVLIDNPDERRKRIRDFGKQAYDAGTGIWPINSQMWYEVYNTTFAELIVRECAKFLEENSGYDDANNAWHPEPEDLLKHFGIE